MPAAPRGWSGHRISLADGRPGVTCGRQERRKKGRHVVLTPVDTLPALLLWTGAPLGRSCGRTLAWERSTLVSSPSPSGLISQEQREGPGPLERKNSKYTHCWGVHSLWPMRSYPRLPLPPAWPHLLAPPSHICVPAPGPPPQSLTLLMAPTPWCPFLGHHLEALAGWMQGLGESPAP